MSNPRIASLRAQIRLKRQELYVLKEDLRVELLIESERRATQLSQADHDRIKAAVAAFPRPKSGTLKRLVANTKGN